MTRRLRTLPRFIFVALLLVLASGAAIAISATPEKGTVSLDSQRTSWQGKEFPESQSFAERQLCVVTADEKCERTDEFELTTEIDPANWETNRGGVEVGIAWENPEDDFDLFVSNKDGQTFGPVGSSTEEDTTSERVFIPEASRDEGPYQVRVQAFSVTEGATYGGGALVVNRAKVAQGGGGGAAGPIPTQPVFDQKCENGMAGVFPCSNVDLGGFLPISEIDGIGENPTIDTGPEQGTFLNDIWGWTDPETKREYALIGKTNGTAFVDVTDASKPVYLGSLPSAQSGGPVTLSTIFKTWRDIKVYKDHAYIGSEEPTHGMQVFDLTKLRGVTEPQSFEADTQYNEFGNSHNIVINEESGFAYAVGTDTCEGGLHMIDLKDPKAPEFAGCVGEDGYTHDAQCVNYKGPDERFVGREICFNSNEDTLTIFDVTDKDNVKEISRTGYELARYTHQGWLTPDGRHFIFNDELDEQDTAQPTTTRYFDVGRLDRPQFKGQYVAKVDSIDHNLYTVGDRVFAANYRSGLRVLDSSKVGDGQLSEVGFFDVFPADDAAEFNGSWSNYPYFESGTVVVSGIEQGLFVLKPRGAAVPTATGTGTDTGNGSGNGSGSGSGGGGNTGSGSGSTSTPNSTPKPTPAPSSATTPNSSPTACASSVRFRSVSFARDGRGARLGFNRTGTAPVTVDVFQTSRGSRVVKERLVARFADETDSVDWNGKANRRGRSVTDGTYFVRYRMRTASGLETRRLVLRRSRGRFSREPDFYRRATCDLLPNFKLERPVFGGRNRSSLGIAYKLAEPGRVSVTVLRGKRVVKRFKTRDVGERYVRLRLSSRGLGRGEYRVRLSARAAKGGKQVTATLTSRKL